MKAEPSASGLSGLRLMSGAPLVTPFVLDYDLLLTGFPLALLFAKARENGFADWERITIAGVFAGAAFARPIGLGLGVPIMPLLLGALFWCVWRRARG